jgi:hypothetical protein
MRPNPTWVEGGPEPRYVEDVGNPDRVLLLFDGDLTVLVYPITVED